MPVLPTNTFPNHVTLVTGVEPERHGLVDNVFRDPERGFFRRQDIPSWIEVEPLWALADRHGIVSASYHWVGSEGHWRDVPAPRHWLPFSSQTPESEKVEQILAWLDEPDPALRPRLITSWFHGGDGAGHDHGPGSAEVRAALRAQDPALSALVEGLEQRDLFGSTTLIFVSDHGMVDMERPVDLTTALADAGVEATVTGIGGFANVYLDDPVDVERAVDVARRLGLEAHARERAPWPVGHVRFGDVVVLAPIGMAIVRPGLQIAGFHGYAPEEPSMSALLVLAGRGVPAGLRLGVVHAIDVAPTVCRLLGVEVPDWMQGTPIHGIGIGIDADVDTDAATDADRGSR